MQKCRHLWYFHVIVEIRIVCNNLKYSVTDVRQERMENNVKQHPSVVLAILACTMDVAKTLDLVSTVLVPMTTLESVVNTNMMLVRLARVRTELRALTKVLVLLAFVHQGTQVCYSINYKTII